MSETTELDQRVRDWAARLDQDRARRRGYLIGAAAMLVVVVVVMLLVWPVIDKNIYLRDDRGLGNSFRSHAHPSFEECQQLAEAVYHHGIAGSRDGDEGYAPRSEKAFFAGCTGGSMPGSD